MVLHLVVFVALAGFVTAKFDPELHKEYIEMPKPSFIKHFNSKNYSWKIAEYKNSSGRLMTCAHVDHEAIKLLPPTIHHRTVTENLPENFDAREKWPECDTIKEIYDQGKCGSCWTFGTATTASDRSCIHKNLHVRLAEQDFECLQNNVCEGGDPIKAFDFWKEEGLVSQECKPYDIEELLENICEAKCAKDDIDYKGDKHFAENVYRVPENIEQIKAELFQNGPIQAAFVVYEDFGSYNSGIYEHTYGERRGGHSVRIIGYGVEDGTEYWLVANSWGTDWGENGYFRVKTNQEALEFESYLVAGMPKN